MSSVFKREIIGLAALSAVFSISALPAWSVPVSTPQGFVNYLNAGKDDWDGGVKIKFKWLSECFNKRSAGGKVKAFVCTNGVIIRKTPNGAKATCKVSNVRVNRREKIKLTYSNCKYK